MDTRLEATLRALKAIGFDVIFLESSQVYRQPRQEQHRQTENLEKPQTDSKKKLLEELYRRIETEGKCPKFEGSSGYVFGEGNPDSPVVFVGEAPGEEEDKLKRPFVGKAGQYLNRKLQEVGLKREDVYITNVVKSRPPNNRKPTKEEIASCVGYLKKEIEIINPKLIVCLGSTALEGIMGKSYPITKYRGQVFQYPFNPKIKVLLTYHPAYILRNPHAEKEFVEDLKKIKELLG
ncbi:uracil-DNA glycosylase [Thermocrinis minervae]|uniref:Type-4 uracil-DNA glycosylase n=1 Tax=Thermocrinis minervae TaxID=381751 RepID=A0A1M6PYW3_9AQUI|nr:uracil-DNA glycosylase [Thermocrinis minervae]SHK13102.1 DNA polymerase [Thermocrinis minervae]